MDWLRYDGTLLRQAHKLNPNSEYRRYTLFAEIGWEAGSWGMPDIKAAHRYEKEFPNGPFIEDVISIIARFYKDLYMVLRDRRSDYK